MLNVLPHSFPTRRASDLGRLEILTPRIAYAAAAGIALTAAGAFAAGIFAVDQATLTALDLARTDAPPLLDGRVDDAAWQAATTATVETQDRKSTRLNSSH